jgi:hypothetical protein
VVTTVVVHHATSARYSSQSASSEPSTSSTPNSSPKTDSNKSKTNPESNTTERGTAGKLEKSPTGKGTVPPSQRAKQRVPSGKEKAKEREDNDNKCANCGNETKAEDTRSHHYPDRHADGGTKTVPVCIGCHTYLHSN